MRFQYTGRRILISFTSMFILALLLTVTLSAQADDVRNHPWQVFVDQNIDGTGMDRLIFVDMLTGDEVEIEVHGERYTTLRQSVMFFNRANQRVMVASADGNMRDHAFVQLEPGERRVDWVLSDDGSRIAWTTLRDTPLGDLRTVTSVANIDGSEQRVIRTDGPQPDIRAVPLAFSSDHTALYMDIAHIDGISNFTPFDLYASIASVDIASGEITPLPNENPANCLCGADFRRDLFVRLRLSANGFDLHVYNLAARSESVIPALNLPNYTAAASVLVTPDATQAVYALARINNFGAENQSIQSVFVLADLQALTQEVLTRPITTFVVPVEWTEDNSTIIFTSPVQDGTWKINLNDARLERIAEATYLGTLQT